MLLNPADKVLAHELDNLHLILQTKLRRLIATVMS